MAISFSFDYNSAMNRDHDCSIGLGRFENTQRPAIVEQIFGEIQHGIKIKIDPEGNVWAKRMCHSPVYLKPLYRNRPNDLFVIDQRPVKVDCSFRP